MTLKDFSKELSSGMLKKGETLLKKNAVRELEKDEQGRYIAFVDDEAFSFDVALFVDAKSFEITDHSCDCEDKYHFCAHKTAVALHLTTKGKEISTSIAKKIRTKKKDAIEILVEEIPEHRLRAWLIHTAKTNKEVLLLLKTEFEARVESLSCDQIINKTNEIFKAVAGQTKKNDTGQINKIVPLLNLYHQTILPELLTGLLEEKNWDLLHAMLDTLMFKYKTQKSSSNKLLKYIEEIVSKITNAAVYYPEEKIVDIASIIFNRVEKLKESNYIFLPFITGNLEKISEVSTQKIMVEKLVKYFTFYHYESENINLLNKVIETDKLLMLADCFTPGYAMNNYNAQLLDALIAANLMENARIVCEKSIDYNSNEKYHLIYIEKMSFIYQHLNNVEKRLDFIKNTITTTYKLSDYLFYIENIEDEKAKNSMEKLLKQRTTSESLSFDQLTFKLALLAHNKEYEKMMGEITLSHPLKYLSLHLEDLVKFDKIKLIHHLIKATTYRFYLRSLTDEDKELLHNIFNQYYTLDDLSHAFDPANIYNVVNKILGKYLIEKGVIKATI